MFDGPILKPDRPGWYTYQVEIPADADHVGVTTPCGVPAETFKVETQPAVQTVVSAERVRPGTALTDTVNVSGLSGETVTVNAALHGPFPTREAIVCTGTPVWTGAFAASADGQYVTEPVTLTTPGFYTYVESIAETDFVRPVANPCGEVSETTVVIGSPQVTTQVSDQTTAPGQTITDSVRVTGLGVLSVPVRVELFGPFASRDAIRCTGTPHWTGEITATGDGVYRTDPVRLEEAGYYAYREQIAEAPQNDASAGACGVESETTLATATPRVVTAVSRQITRRGAAVFDRVRVRGLVKTRAKIELALYGPFRHTRRRAV